LILAVPANIAFKLSDLRLFFLFTGSTSAEQQSCQDFE